MSEPTEGQFSTIHNRVRSVVQKHAAAQESVKTRAQQHNLVRQQKRAKMAAEQQMTADAKKGNAT